MSVMEDEKVGSVYDLNLPGLWNEHREMRLRTGKRAASSWPAWKDTRSFTKMLEGLLEYPDEASAVMFCTTCMVPVFDDETYADIDGEVHCESCIEMHFSKCACCEEYVRDSDLYNTIDEDYDTCMGCRDQYFRYCDWCDGFYHVSWDHWHDDEDVECDCDSVISQPHVRSFGIRNGEEILRNDVRVPFSIPAGSISEQGMNEVHRACIDWAYQDIYRVQNDSDAYTKAHGAISDMYNRIEPVWQTREGNFPKRVSRMLHNGGVTIPKDLVTKIGNIARSHADGVDFEVAITRDLNLPASEFAHAGSCWWGEYNYARCALKNNGGFALRSFDNGRKQAYGTDVSGRAWVLPMKNLASGPKPTFETEKPEGFVVFNGYGRLSGYVAARIIAQMTGWSYRKISFECEDFYVNNEAGYLVGPEDLIEDFGMHEDGRYIQLSLDTHNTEIDVLERTLVNA